MRNSFLTLAVCMVAILCGDRTHVLAGEQPMVELELNKDAGRGGWVIVTLHSEAGKNLPFLIDTGASHTLFDRAQKPDLKEDGGKTTISIWQGEEESRTYLMPRLYAGAMLLKAGKVTAVQEISSHVGQPIAGIMGMDVLSHYCVQLDFEAGKMRLLDSGVVNTNWGKALKLVRLRRGDARPAIGENFLGMKGAIMQIDTGDPSDGWLRPKYFAQWTNSVPLAEAHSPNAVLGSWQYPDVSLRRADVFCDGVGLRFLSRHLVTFDFPKGVMYLNRIIAEPRAEIGRGGAVTFLIKQIMSGQLPGWSKGEHGVQVGTELDPATGVWTIHLRKANDASTYNYSVKPLPGEISWKVEEGWRSDSSNRVLERYPAATPPG